LANEKSVLFLASDCLGANKPGYTKGEKEIEANMEGIARSAKKAVFLTAISSNIGRFQQMMNIAQRLKRKVVLVGRSVQKKIEIAYEGWVICLFQKTWSFPFVKLKNCEEKKLCISFQVATDRLVALFIEFL